jgi:primosomal protein N'
MYVLVRLLKGYPKPLLYKIPPQLTSSNLLGKIVHVGLKNQTTYALVLKTYKNLPSKTNFEIKEIIQIQDFPQDNLYHNFVEKISKFYFIEPLHFYQRIRNFIFKQKKGTPNTDNYKTVNPILNTQKIVLTPEQQKIIISLEEEIDEKTYSPCLIHGVTGSGKTEIYKKIIIKCIQRNK